MKIGVRRIGPLGNLYNDIYGKEFYDKLWEQALVQKLGNHDEVVWFDRMPIDSTGFDQVLDDFDALIGAWIFDGMVTEEILAKHPKLKYIGTISHGYGEIDKAACLRHGVTITNTYFNDYAVAQHTMALLLEIVSHVGENSEYYKIAKWETPELSKNKLFTRQMELDGKVFGIIGLGSIGFRVAKMARGFGMKVQAYSKHRKDGDEYSFIRQVDFETLLATSDIISLHCASNSETKGMINSKSIKTMKNGVIILNSARGDLVDEKALLEALGNPSGDDRAKIRAAGLDVLSGEPLASPTKLLRHPRVIATEHIAWATPEARVRSVTTA